MSNQLQITGGAKVRSLEGVITGTSGVLNSLPINTSNGIPQLDVNGKILVSQLPNSVMEYKGTWDAATNTPTLTDGTGNQGDVYLCNVAGTVNFGSGPIQFFVGDQVLYSGTVWQRASGATGSVTSVALTESGDALNITGSPITTSGTINIGFNGTSGQYINGAGNLTTFPSLTGYVPYSGATQSVILGEWGLRSGYVSFDTTPTGTPTTQGTLSWNADKESLDLILNGTTGSLMQDTFYNVKNQTGSTIPKGTVVRANGTVGASGRILIAPFLADGTYSSKYCMGVTAEDIIDGADGKVLAFGALRKINTSAYANGTILYASPSSAGAFTTTEPSNPNNIVTLAIVVYSDATNGEIFVRPTFVPSQAELILSLGYTPANAARTLTINGTSYDLTADRTWSVGTLTGNGTAGNIPYYTGTTTLGNENGFMYDSSTNRFGVNTTVPNATIGANASIDSGYSLLLKNADANYNGLGFGLDSTYGNLITTQKIGTAAARNFTLQNQSGYVSIDESGNFGVNILTPKGGVDIYSSTTAALYLHNSASGVAATDGVRLSLNSTNANLRNYESGTLSMTSEGDFSIITAATENFRVNSADGSIYQSKVANAMLKSVSGVITAAVAGTDYLDPSSLSGYVPTSRTISINGTTQDLSSNRSWSVGTLTGGGAASRVAFWDGASNVVSDSLFVWDDTNNRLGIGLTNPQRALEIYSASADTHLRLSGSAPSVSMGEAITGSIYQAKFGLATANNQFVTGSVAGDFVINNQTGATIWAYNSTEKMRLDTNGNLGIGGIANSSYRLHVFGTAPLLGIESTTTGNVALRFLQAGTVVSGITYFNSDSTLRITNNNGGVRIGTSGLDPALSIASTGAATFASSVTASGGVVIAGNASIASTAASIWSNTYLQFNSGSAGISFNNSNNTAGLFTILNTGAATFSSSVTAGSEFISYSGINMDAGGGTIRGGLTINYSTGEFKHYCGIAGNGYFQTFHTNGSERMRITSGGFTKISNNGTYNSSTGGFHEIYTNNSNSYIGVLTHAASTNPYGFWLNYSAASPNSTTNEFLYFTDSTNSKFIVWSNGSVVNRTGSYGTISDIKFKENIVDATPKLSDLLKLKVRNFNMIGQEEKHIGFIAQEFEEVFPKMVDTSIDKDSGDEFKSIKTSVLVPMLVKAIQELKQELDELKAKIN